jgi:hypothetical protein
MVAGDVSAVISREMARCIDRGQDMRAFIDDDLG